MELSLLKGLSSTVRGGSDSHLNCTHTAVLIKIFITVGLKITKQKNLSQVPSLNLKGSNFSPEAISLLSTDTPTCLVFEILPCLRHPLRTSETCQQPTNAKRINASHILVICWALQQNTWEATYGTRGLFCCRGPGKVLWLAMGDRACLVRRWEVMLKTLKAHPPTAYCLRPDHTS